MPIYYYIFIYCIYVVRKTPGKSGKVADPPSQSPCASHLKLRSFETKAQRLCIQSNGSPK